MSFDFRLTIAVCCHADTPYFEEMLDSFIHAKVVWPKTELLICDDGSPNGGDGDKARQLLNRKDLPFSVRVIRHDTHWNTAASKQHLREEAKGEYLLFFDSDDVFMAFDVIAELDFLDAHSEYCGSYGKKIYFDGEHGFTGSCQGGDYSAFEMLIIPPLSINGMIVRASDLRQAWGFVLPDETKLNRGDDICLWYGCALKKPFYFSGNFRALYRNHPGQLTFNAGEEYKKTYRCLRDFCYKYSADLREKLHSGERFSFSPERRWEMLILLGAEFADADGDESHAKRMLDIAETMAPDDYGIREMRIRLLFQKKCYSEIFREIFLMYAEHPNSTYISQVAFQNAITASMESGSNPNAFQRLFNDISKIHFYLTDSQKAFLDSVCANARRLFELNHQQYEVIPKVLILNDKKTGKK